LMGGEIEFMKHLGTVSIETERLILRKFMLTDAKAMYHNWAKDDEVTKYLTWPSHPSADISEKIIQSWLKNYDEAGNYQWCIELKSIGEAIGSISVVNRNDEIGSVEVGYCIGRAFWNQGIVSEALAAVMKFFFDEAEVNRIEARHDINNPNSGKVMLKCGFVYEGTRRKADKNNQGICDAAMYGILAEDYKFRGHNIAKEE
jgi:ribosomal-protein-alanine N-acetyltransferase